MKTVVVVALGVGAAIVGWWLAFALWGVGYCGSLTPDSPPPGSLRSDLCRGTSGDVMGGVAVSAGLLAAAAPFIGAYWARRSRRVWPLLLCVIVGVAPLAAIAILAATLPQA
jgi:hypothetical protein